MRAPSYPPLPPSIEYLRASGQGRSWSCGEHVTWLSSRGATVLVVYTSDMSFSVSLSSVFALTIPALLMRRFSPEPLRRSPTLAAAALMLAGSVTSAEARWGGESPLPSVSASRHGAGTEPCTRDVGGRSAGRAGSPGRHLVLQLCHLPSGTMTRLGCLEANFCSSCRRQRV